MLADTRSQTPEHIAIIMDGNGRWAERRGRPRIFGHIKGCGRVREIIREADRLGVKKLTLYAFSSENWGRPTDEVSVLMRLLYKWLIRERRELLEKNIRFRAIGAIHRLPVTVQRMVEDTMKVSQENSGLQVTLALSYGGREELVTTARRLASRVVSGEISVTDINEDLFSSQLWTADIGDPDLLIRTSGEQRISNFLLWQLAYAELYFTDKMWPDFKASDLRLSLDAYSRRQRRFGLTEHQLEVRV